MTLFPIKKSLIISDYLSIPIYDKAENYPHKLSLFQAGSRHRNISPKTIEPLYSSQIVPVQTDNTYLPELIYGFLSAK
jgi:hypothetical protein